jgi:guanylate kinase
MSPGTSASFVEDRSKASSLIRPLLVLISAPSGGGKTTLCDQLIAVRADMTRAVTCTTRPPRPGEREGIDYYFLSADAFHKRVEAGDFLEHATVHGHSYGTLQSEVREKMNLGKDVLLNLDVQGAATIRAKAQRDPDLKAALVSVFLTPLSITVLEARLRKRGTDSEAVIQKRLNAARHEIEHWKDFDYLIVSESIGDDLRRMQLILDAEKMKSTRVQGPDFDAETGKALCPNQGT